MVGRNLAATVFFSFQVMAGRERERAKKRCYLYFSGRRSSTEGCRVEERFKQSLNALYMQAVMS